MHKKANYIQASCRNKKQAEQKPITFQKQVQYMIPFPDARIDITPAKAEVFLLLLSGWQGNNNILTSVPSVAASECS